MATASAGPYARPTNSVIAPKANVRNGDKLRLKACFRRMFKTKICGLRDELFQIYGPAYEKAHSLCWLSIF